MKYFKRMLYFIPGVLMALIPDIIYRDRDGIILGCGIITGGFIICLVDLLNRDSKF
jgi:hypothetical protein